jgi:hypothetical protein
LPAAAKYRCSVACFSISGSLFIFVLPANEGDILGRSIPAHCYTHPAVVGSYKPWLHEKWFVKAAVLTTLLGCRLFTVRVLCHFNVVSRKCVLIVVISYFDVMIRSIVNLWQ